MRELNWKEIKASDEKRSSGEGSLDASYLLAGAAGEHTEEGSGENNIYIEETPPNTGRDPGKTKESDKNNGKKKASRKSSDSYQRLFFPLVMFILTLMIVFLYVVLVRVGAAGAGRAAVEFVQGTSPLGFSSIFYVFFFLPVILLLYYLIPGRWTKPIILLITSLVFYSFAQPAYLVVLLLVCFFNYLAGMEIAARKKSKIGRRVIGIFGIAGNLLLPVLFVYLPWASSVFNWKNSIPNIAIPLGLMFLTLRGIVYLVDIWRGTGEAETDFFLFSLYYTFFPTIALGPIDRYQSLRPAFVKLFIKKRASALEIFSSGVERFLFGFFKKTLLASPLYVLTIRIRQVPETENTVFLAWILALAYALWLLLELSAYTDMAIGTARMLGFRISESFNYPFLSLSIRDFWSRWQITVTGWLRENIYRPVCGKNGSAVRGVLGILLAAVIFTIGHGPNPAYFILAAYMVILLVLCVSPVGRFFARFPDTLRWLFTAFLLLIASAILLGASSANVFSPLFALFGGLSGGVANATMLYLLRTHLVLLVVAVAAAAGLFWKLYRLIRRKIPVIAFILMIILFGLAVSACIGQAAPDTFMRIVLG